jgi:lipid A ethanolaminephosphotransferase
MAKMFTVPRPTVRVETLVGLVMLYLVAVANGPWWSTVLAGRTLADPHSWLFMVCMFISLAALNYVLVAPISSRWTARPLLTFVVLAAQVAAQYMSMYAVIMDPTMVQNVLKTDSKEAADLISWGLVIRVVAWSAPALLVIWLVRLERLPWLRATIIRLVSIFGALVLAVLGILPVARDLVSMMRNDPQARYLITPANLLYGLTYDLGGAARDVGGPREKLGIDARVAAPAAHPRLLVLVIGETARAANFSLFGYTRATNPELAKRDILAFSNVKSCGTSTEVSVPCMFSRLGRQDYDARAIRRSEGLLDVLVHAGYAVKWIDNQSGCKGVCQGAGIEVRKIDPLSDGGLCHDNECADEILARNVAAELATLKQDTVIVLHMMGNHGPAYFRRYPPAFRRFVPDCATAQLRDCTRDEVVSAYDNAILYSDFVLSRIVDLLAAQDSVESSMIYVSDHGESLGEGGLYLHGIPYAFAPSEQTHVPLIVWLSKGRAAASGIDLACARGRLAERFSHDNLFDTALGLLDVSSSVYRPGQDIFAPCRARRPVQ